jgi:hypothetical protein
MMQDPTKYTLGQAAKATGRSKTTLATAHAKGVISGKRNPNGSYEFDPSEVHRVYPMITPDSDGKQSIGLSKTGENAGFDSLETAVLAQKVKGLEALLNEREEALKDLRNRLDQSDQERRDAQNKLMALLTDQRLKPEPEQSTPEPMKKKRWWQ